MTARTVAIVLLAILLVASNVFWAYRVFDGAVSYTYLESSYRDARLTALQAIAVLSEVARDAATQESVIAAARSVAPESEPFEKEGFVWVGGLGLRFDAAGHFVEASPAVEPF